MGNVLKIAILGSLLAGLVEGATARGRLPRTCRAVSASLFGGADGPSARELVSLRHRDQNYRFLGSVERFKAGGRHFNLVVDSGGGVHLIDERLEDEYVLVLDSEGGARIGTRKSPSNVQTAPPPSRADDVVFNIPAEDIREYDYKGLKKWMCGRWDELKGSPDYRRLKEAVMGDARRLDADYLWRVKRRMCSRFSRQVFFAGAATFMTSMFDHKLAEYGDDPVTRFFAYHSTNFFIGMMPLAFVHCPHSLIAPGVERKNLMFFAGLNAVVQYLKEIDTDELLGRPPPPPNPELDEKMKKFEEFLNKGGLKIVRRPNDYKDFFAGAVAGPALYTSVYLALDAIERSKPEVFCGKASL